MCTDFFSEESRSCVFIVHSARMTKRNPIECDEFRSLKGETLRLYSEWDAIRGQVNQTPKRAPEYADKVRQLKQSEGKWHHASQNLNQHVRDHRCRYSN